jgi:hypothetical protein
VQARNKELREFQLAHLEAIEACKNQYRGQGTRPCFGSWNQIGLWLRQCDNLRSTAVSAP